MFYNCTLYDTNKVEEECLSKKQRDKMMRREAGPTDIAYLTGKKARQNVRVSTCDGSCRGCITRKDGKGRKRKEKDVLCTDSCCVKINESYTNAGASNVQRSFLLSNSRQWETIASKKQFHVSQQSISVPSKLIGSLELQ